MIARRSALSSVFVGSALFAGAVPAWGQAEPVWQSRNVSAETYAAAMGCPEDDHDSGSVSAPESFEPWEFSLLVWSTACDVGVTAFSTQRSELNPGLIRASGSADYQTAADLYSSQTAVADSRFDYRFRLSAPATFSLTGRTELVLANSHEDLPYARVRLSGDGLDIMHEGGDGGPVFSFSGGLAPGTYVISAAASANGFSSPGEEIYERSEFQLELVIAPLACACDWNTDGARTTADFFEFLHSFLTGAADFNADGSTRSQDFFDFLSCFFTPPAACG
jgi:hypothetical protein